MDELIELIEGEKFTDSMGTDTIKPSSTKRRTVYAEIRSIGMTEHYQAMAYDDVPDMKAIVYREEYAGEPFVAYAGKTYDVKRTYRNGEVMELTCEEVTA